MTNKIESDQDKTENENTDIVQMTNDPTHDNISEIVLVGELRVTKNF